MEFPVYIHKTSLSLLPLNICGVTAETGSRLKETLAFKASLKNAKLGAGFALSPSSPSRVMWFICSNPSPIPHALPSVRTFKASPTAAFAIYQWEIKEKGGKVRKTHHHVPWPGIMGVKKGWGVSLSNETQSLPRMWVLEQRIRTEQDQQPVCNKVAGIKPDKTKSFSGKTQERVQNDTHSRGV